MLCATHWACAQTLVRLESNEPGPCVLVVGGIHGDEPSGVHAVQQLARLRPPRRGRLLLLAEGNPAAVAAGTRFTETDMNRAFPGEKGTAARAVFDAAQGVDLVLDLHEAGAAWPEADVPTLVISPSSAPFALTLLEVMRTDGLPFAFTGGAPAGSLVAVLEARRQQAITVEVPARWRLSKRVRVHRRVVEAALHLLGMR